MIFMFFLVFYSFKLAQQAVSYSSHNRNVVKKLFALLKEESSRIKKKEVKVGHNLSAKTKEWEIFFLPYRIRSSLLVCSESLKAKCNLCVRR